MLRGQTLIPPIHRAAVRLSNEHGSQLVPNDVQDTALPVTGFLLSAVFGPVAVDQRCHSKFTSRLMSRCQFSSRADIFLPLDLLRQLVRSVHPRPSGYDLLLSNGLSKARHVPCELILCDLLKELVLRSAR
jgi:hypothetical protein